MRVHNGSHPGPTVGRRDQGRLQRLRRTPRDGCRAPHDEQRCHRTGPRRLRRRDLVGTGRQRPGTPVLRPRRLDGRRRVTQSHMPDYTHPSNVESRSSGPMKATGLDQFRIGLDRRGPGISTDSARVRRRWEITGTIWTKTTREGAAPLPRGTTHLRCSTSAKPQVRLPNVQPGDRPPDQHPLDFRRALEDREDLRGKGSGTGIPAPTLTCANIGTQGC
jgi:hypothetical protein